MPEKLQLERVSPDLPAKEFFAKYVSSRKPVIITGLLDDPTFQGRKWGDLDYLAKKAGDVEVMVEPIHPTANQYGTDVERIPTMFRDFLGSLRSDDGPHPYLTTQYSEEDPDAETVFPPPTNALRDEFPIVPRIMGNLFLQQVNLWLGKSKEGSSSGLHHDFHDNIYCLLKGRKRFVLFPPSEVEHLYPYGTLDTLHPNGLIAYEDIPVRADGLSKRAACKARVRALERKIDALKAKSKGKTKGKGKGPSRELQALIHAHDAALDELAEAELDDVDAADEDQMDDFDALMGDLDDLQDAGPGPSKKTSHDDEDGEGDAEEEWKGIGHSDDDKNASDGEGIDGAEDGDDSDDDEEDEGALREEKAGPSEPSSFSRIPTAHLHQYLGLPTTAVLPQSFDAEDFPELEKTTDPYVVELSEGEMLYLPASWWHEVTSTSAGGDGVHMAFNYWFYPPDALDRHDAPYRDTLVWDYLRQKRDGEASREPAAKTHAAKRARESVGGGDSKKVRR